jgi:hypothetical protein
MQALLSRGLLQKQAGTPSIHPSFSNFFGPWLNCKADSYPKGEAPDVHCNRNLNWMGNEAFNAVIDQEWNGELRSDVDQKGTEGENYVVVIVLQRHANDGQSDGCDDTRQPHVPYSIFRTPDSIVEPSGNP